MEAFNSTGVGEMVDWFFYAPNASAKRNNFLP